MKIVVTGAGGQLGREVFTYFSKQKGIQVAGFTRTEWDVTQFLQTEQVLEEKQPDVVIHCAAYTQVDSSEEKPSLAYLVNVAGTRHLAEQCGKRGIRLVYVSTDYVFDGNSRNGYLESDPPHPLNQYGRTKRLGEKWVQRCCPDHLILRTSWLYGTYGHNFVRTILQKARTNETLSVVNDQIGSPTYSGHLVRQMDLLLRTHALGIFHTAGTGSCSWYQFAKKILDFAGMNDVPIQAISSSQLQRKAKRPFYSILRSTRLKVEGVPEMPHWKEGLQEFFQEIQGEIGDD